MFYPKLPDFIKNNNMKWSSMIQRKNWHFSLFKVGQTLEQKRKTVNAVVRNFVP